MIVTSKKVFRVPDTVICMIEIRNNADDELVDPDSVTITINKDVQDEPMIKQSKGVYRYYFQTEGKSPGKYIVIYKITDGEIITVHDDVFYLES